MIACMRVAILLAALWVFVGCNDRTREIVPRGNGSSFGPDLGVVDDAGFDQPVRGLCVPGSRRCVTENSPLYEECVNTGTAFFRDACDDGEVCREGACIPFACVPGRPLCVGATTSATCDETGAAVADARACEGAEVCVGGACVDPCQVARDARSYITCEYAAQELPNLYQTLSDTSASPFAVVVANPAPLVSAQVTIRDAQGIAPLREPFRLNPGPSYAVGDATELQSEVLLADGTVVPVTTAESVELPPGAAGVFLLAGTGDYDVRSTRPVVAYQFSPYCCNFTATNDASLLLPRSAWGTRYRAIGYPAWQLSAGNNWYQAYLSVVAEVDTTLRVTSPAPLRADTGESGTELTLALEANRPVLLSTAMRPEDAPEDLASDFTGAVLEADAPIGVFTGHPCTFVPTDQWACDHLQESLLPAEILGARYLLTPVRRRSDPELDDTDRDIREATYWRIVADERAELRFDPPLEDLPTLPPSNPSSPSCLGLTGLDPGQFCEFGTTRPTALNATGALLVAGVISGHQSTGVRFYGTQAGDPSLFILPPVEQFRTNYAFVSPQTFLRTYVTVAAAPSAPITIDGRSIPAEQRLERRSVELDGRTWEVFTIAIEPGVHRMASDTRFGIIAYAYDDYVSYAFTGGLDLVPKGGR